MVAEQITAERGGSHVANADRIGGRRPRRTHVRYGGVGLLGRRGIRARRPAERSGAAGAAGARAAVHTAAQAATHAATHAAARSAAHTTVHAAARAGACARARATAHAAAGTATRAAAPATVRAATRATTRAAGPRRSGGGARDQARACARGRRQVQDLPQAPVRFLGRDRPRRQDAAARLRIVSWARERVQDHVDHEGSGEGQGCRLGDPGQDLLQRELSQGRMAGRHARACTRAQEWSRRAAAPGAACFVRRSRGLYRESSATTAALLSIHPGIPWAASRRGRASEFSHNSVRADDFATHRLPLRRPWMARAPGSSLRVGPHPRRHRSARVGEDISRRRVRAGRCRRRPG